MRLNGKVALVTGASRGIGFTVAELFAREGAIVYAGSSSNPPGIFPAGVTGVELDVSKEEHWKRVVAEIVAAYGRVDVLVNNAGIAVYDAVHDCSTENWRKVLGVNQDGCFLSRCYNSLWARLQESGVASAPLNGLLQLPPRSMVRRNTEEPTSQ